MVKQTAMNAKDKSIKREELGRGERPDTGGDQFDRARGNYAKNPPVREESDPFAPYDDY